MYITLTFSSSNSSQFFFVNNFIVVFTTNARIFCEAETFYNHSVRETTLSLFIAALNAKLYAKFYPLILRHTRNAFKFSSILEHKKSISLKRVAKFLAEHWSFQVWNKSSSAGFLSWSTCFDRSLYITCNNSEEDI